jgi:pSer/pThr/pTyr-binding forkhead associated (FHA) protein
MLISRHHCQLDVDPPSVQVLDLGSANGTFLNGQEVKSSLKDFYENAGAAAGHGDLLTIGGTTMRVEIVECPHAGKNESSGKAIWESEEAVIKDCPLPC